MLNFDFCLYREARIRGGIEKLKKALKAEISEEAWDSMNSTVSRPFPMPTSGKIAVKAINHFGDEVMKVFGVN